MSKKRVHELAKEYGLENKEVIKLLQGAGLEVKTHSSSVYEDEARAVLGKASGGGATAQPKADEEKKATPKKKRPGMMIVRKKKKAPDETAAEVVARERAEARAAEEVQQEQTPEAEAVTESMTEEASPAEEQVQPEQREQPEKAAEAQPHAEEQHPAEQEAASEEEPSEESANEKKRPQPNVVRMIDRDKLLERVPGRRLGSEGGGQKKFGQVTELKVVNDPFGRGREMVDVGRDKKGRKQGGGAKRRERGRGDRFGMRERTVLPSRLRKRKTAKDQRPPGERPEATLPKESKRVIKMKETIVVAELAKQLGVKAVEVIQKLFSLGVMANQNESIDFETAQLIGGEFNYRVESVAFEEEQVLDIDSGEDEDKDEDLKPRPPVVTVMGHVDHGKTSLLDYIRNSRVAAKEAGGITQHIGAYQVSIPKKGTITFLDTPGHAAFTQMRARGANATDIVILVVAADDGVMPQTEEAVRHAQAAEVPIIVAVNKIDKPEANPDRVMQELANLNLIPESWGGDTMYINTSAIKGDGVNELLEAVLLQSEVLELKANPERNAQGMVIEAKLDKGRGPVATVLIQRGTLKRGQAVVVGETHGKVRAMLNDQGKQTKSAGPSMPVEITGLDGVPEAGDVLHAADKLEDARSVAEHRLEQKRADAQGAAGRMSLDDLMSRMQEEESLELKVVLKADVQGSCEAVRDALAKLSTDEVKVNVILSSAGGIKESDIALAAASNGIVLGFNVRPDSNARTVAEREGVEIRTYNVIYEMIDDVKKAMEGLLSPESREKIVGRAEVRDTFKISKVGTIAGCRVVEGKARRSARVRVLRDSVEVYDGTVSSLKHFKEDAREVDSGLECGVGVEGFNDIKPGDVIEFYSVEEVARTLDSGANKRSSSAEAHP